MEKSAVQEFRKKASLESAGSSSDKILQTFIDRLSRTMKPASRLIDIGCGQGTLLRKVQDLFPNGDFTGVDYTAFKDLPFSFYQHDCNQPFPENWGTFDFTVASEVIEHLENPRHFLRELSKMTAPGGHIMISTPNIESLTSLLSFSLRGYHSAFGPRSYPAHITPVGTFDLKNMIQEIPGLTLEELYFIPNGRIPGTSLEWQKVFPGTSGKWFSDNYFIHIKKEG